MGSGMWGRHCPVGVAVGGEATQSGPIKQGQNHQKSMGFQGLFDGIFMSFLMDSCSCPSCRLKGSRRTLIQSWQLKSDQHPSFVVFFFMTWRNETKKTAAPSCIKPTYTVEGSKLKSIHQYMDLWSNYLAIGSPTATGFEIKWRYGPVWMCVQN